MADADDREDEGGSDIDRSNAIPTGLEEGEGFEGEGGEGRQAAAESGFEDGGAQGSPWALIPCGADDDTDEDGAQDIGGQGHPWEGGQGGKGGGK